MDKRYLLKEIRKTITAMQKLERQFIRKGEQHKQYKAYLTVLKEELLKMAPEMKEKMMPRTPIVAEAEPVTDTTWQPTKDTVSETK